MYACCAYSGVSQGCTMRKAHLSYLECAKTHAWCVYHQGINESASELKKKKLWTSVQYWYSRSCYPLHSLLIRTIAWPVVISQAPTKFEEQQEKQTQQTKEKTRKARIMYVQGSPSTSRVVEMELGNSSQNARQRQYSLRVLVPLHVFSGRRKTRWADKWLKTFGEKLELCYKNRSSLHPMYL